MIFKKYYNYPNNRCDVSYVDIKPHDFPQDADQRKYWLRMNGQSGLVKITNIDNLHPSARANKGPDWSSFKIRFRFTDPDDTTLLLLDQIGMASNEFWIMRRQINNERYSLDLRTLRCQWDNLSILLDISDVISKGYDEEDSID